MEEPELPPGGQGELEGELGDEVDGEEAGVVATAGGEEEARVGEAGWADKLDARAEERERDVKMEEKVDEAAATDDEGGGVPVMVCVVMMVAVDVCAIVVVCRVAREGSGAPVDGATGAVPVDGPPRPSQALSQPS